MINKIVKVGVKGVVEISFEGIFKREIKIGDLGEGLGIRPVGRMQGEDGRVGKVGKAGKKERKVCFNCPLSDWVFLFGFYFEVVVIGIFILEFY